MNIEHRTSNIECRMRKKMTKQAYHLEERLLKKPNIPLLHFSLLADERTELSSISVTSIKTAVRQAQGPERSRRAEKKRK
jgi:hypothetical protein